MSRPFGSFGAFVLCYHWIRKGGHTIKLSNITGHLKTITRHKLLVAKLCFRCHLYYQGLVHDLSKYSYIELKTGFKYYQGGKRSPIGAERRATGLSLGWLHHKGRNRHHWEYWLDDGPDGIVAQKMPVRYVIEMFCDTVAASMIYQGKDYRDDSALKYYEDHAKGRLIHSDTDALLRHLYVYLATDGLDATIAHILKDIKR